MSVKSVNIPLGERSYSIYIGDDLLNNPQHLLSCIRGKRCALVTNDTVGPLYAQRLLTGLSQKGIQVVEIVLPDGEQYKNWETLQTIFDKLLENHCERNTTLVALGGGVVGDIAGFAAACYQRGMPFVQVPTTLLAQVDSSVGGKTAINHPLGKNMIGAFYQPQMVIADTSVLGTLPNRELSAGLAEVIKYGLIRDAEFFMWLEENLTRLRNRDLQVLAEAIERSCRHKAEVVASDERESGVRALLNLGHTFGHAIESGMGYGTWLHGEAVAVGTVIAAEVSHRSGWISIESRERIERAYQAAGLPTRGPGMTPEQYLELMLHDKKVADGKIQYVLLRDIGNAFLTADVPVSIIRESIAACTAP